MRTAVLLTVVMGVVAFSTPPQATPSMEIETLSPIIFVDEIEPCVSFWTAIGFENAGEAPHQDKIGFIMLQKDDVSVMYQSFASAEADIPGLVERPLRTTTAVYLRIKGFDDLLPKLEGVDVVQEERMTFYGAREIFVRAPCGTVVGFAEMQENG